jgi:hypothetical protein
VKLRKLDISYVDKLPAGLKSACLLLPGTLNARVELDELPKELPAVIICRACDAYLERLLNERGVAVTATTDPVDSVPDGAEVTVDLGAGSLIETTSGRRFALRPLKPNHLASIRSHG